MKHVTVAMFYKDHKDFVIEMFILCIAEAFVMRLSRLINPRPEGYGSRLVIHSFIH